MNLQEQLDIFLNKQQNKEKYIDSIQFKEMFLLGFARQLQIDVEQFFNFEVIDTNDGNCQIVARLKKEHETVCNILNEFFLKENFIEVKKMFGVPDSIDVQPIEDGTVELQ